MKKESIRNLCKKIIYRKNNFVEIAKKKKNWRDCMYVCMYVSIYLSIYLRV